LPFIISATIENLHSTGTLESVQTQTLNTIRPYLDFKTAAIPMYIVQLYNCCRKQHLGCMYTTKQYKTLKRRHIYRGHNSSINFFGKSTTAEIAIKVELSNYT